MKRSLIAVAIGTLFAAPAFADYETGLKRNEIQPGVTYGEAAEVDKSRGKVRAELKRAGPQAAERTRENLGLDPEVEQSADKTRAQVRSEVAEAYRKGELIENAELGETPPRM